jgi:hypothetical protein
MGGVDGFAGHPECCDGDNICDEIRKGIHGVGCDGGAVSEDPAGKFQDHQSRIGKKTDPGDFQGLLTPVFIGFFRRFGFLLSVPSPKKGAARFPSLKHSRWDDALSILFLLNPQNLQCCMPEWPVSRKQDSRRNDSENDCRNSGIGPFAIMNEKKQTGRHGRHRRGQKDDETGKNEFLRRKEKFWTG